MRTSPVLRYGYLLAAVSSLFGCSTTVVTGDGQGGGGASSSTGDGNPCYPDSCTAPSSTGAGPTMCGGTQCTATEACVDLSETCGKLGSVACRPKSECGDGRCGCDGVVYADECDARAHGVGVSFNGGCTPPPGTFACGSKFCSPLSEYCYTFQEGFGTPTQECKPLPSACTANGATPTCECLQTEPAITAMCDDVGGSLSIHDHL